jgi:hypothetical protein
LSKSPATPRLRPAQTQDGITTRSGSQLSQEIFQTPISKTLDSRPENISNSDEIFSSPEIEKNYFFGTGSKRPFSFVQPIFDSQASSSKKISYSDPMEEVLARLARLEEAHAEIFALKKALSESEAARHALEAQVASLLGTKSAPPPPTQASSYASAATKNLPVKKSKKTQLPSPRRATAAVGRLFGSKAGSPSEYQYLYYSTSVRRPLKELRRILQAFGVNVSRILDIQYPDSHVISFLLHADYIVEFTSLFYNKGRGGLPLQDYDPLSPSSLRDPKFDSLSLDLRVQKAREIENRRCLRSLSFVRRSARLSVARSFLHYDRINQVQFDTILAEERAARTNATVPPSKSSSVEELAAKNQRLDFLGLLLHHDKETASLLAYDAPLVNEDAMSDS